MPLLNKSTMLKYWKTIKSRFLKKHYQTKRTWKKPSNTQTNIDCRHFPSETCGSTKKGIPTRCKYEKIVLFTIQHSKEWMQQLLSPLPHSSALAEVYRLYLHRGMFSALKVTEFTYVRSWPLSKYPCHWFLTNCLFNFDWGRKPVLLLYLMITELIS